MTGKETPSENHLTTPVRSEESFRRLLHHPLLTTRQEALIFSIGQQDPHYPTGVDQNISRDAISTVDLQAHPLFPSFLAQFSDKDRQKSEQLLGASDTLTEYLIRHYQRRVYKLAKAAHAKIVDAEVTLHDVLQEGNIGLTRAINAYDPRKISPSSDRPALFSTFSTTVIRNALISEVRKRNRRFGTPLHVVHALKRFNTEVELLGRHLGRTPTEKEIRERFSSLGTIAPELVATFLTNNQIVVSPQSLNQQLHSQYEGEHGTEFGATLASDEDTEQTALANLAGQAVFAQLLARLSDHERSVLIRRGFDGGRKQTLEEIGRTDGVTRERIRQIEWKGLELLNQLLRAEILGEEPPEGIANDHTYHSHFRRRNQEAHQEAQKRKQQRLAATSAGNVYTRETDIVAPITAADEMTKPQTTPKEQEKEVAALIDQGRSDLDVAIQLNRNLEGIRGIRRRLGLKRADQRTSSLPPAFEQQRAGDIDINLREAARLMKDQPDTFEQLLTAGEKRKVTTSPEENPEKVIPPAENTKQLPPLDPVMSFRQARKLMRKNPRKFESLLEKRAQEEDESEN